MSGGTDAALLARVEPLLRRLPRGPRGLVERVLSRWVGRTVVRAAEAFARVEVFDRAMVIAAQFFSSVLPILILAATWSEADVVAGVLGIPDDSLSLIDEAVGGADSAAFGIVGTVLVLVSATSLSRALARALAVVWEVPRPRVEPAKAWRWVVVVLVLSAAVVLGQFLGHDVDLVPPRVSWPTVLTFAADVAVATFIPWVLLSAGLSARLLLPGAALFAVVMQAVRPASAAWMPYALEVSAERYGPIGLAFTYLAWLYVVCFAYVSTAVLGQVLATDRGAFGAWLRGGRPRLTHLG